MQEEPLFVSISVQMEKLTRQKVVIKQLSWTCKSTWALCDCRTGWLEEECKYASYAFAPNNILCIDIFSSTKGPCQSYLHSIDLLNLSTITTRFFPFFAFPACKCGIEKKGLERRIVGGIEVNPVRSLASHYWTSPSNNSHLRWTNTNTL